MQSPSIQDFPLNSKRRLQLQNQHNAQLQLQLQQQQQQQQQQDCDDMMIEGPPFKKQRPGVATNFLYKFVELAAYTSTLASAATDAISTITGGLSTGHIYDYDDEVLHIRDDEDEESDLYDHKFDKKDESAWEENARNVEEEEPPPPYDSSWSMPSPSTTTHDKIPETRPLTTPALSSSPSQEEHVAPQQPLTSQNIVTKSSTNTTSRRRQFRVRRGRRLLRRKSSSVDMSNSFNASSTSPQPENDEDEDDIFLKFNCKLTGMIAEGKAALNSTVEVTDVEMMIAEEKERDERIKKEFGIQTSANGRRARRHTGSSSSSDFDYYSSILGSNQSSTPSCDNGFNGGLSCYTSPTVYSIDNGFSPNRTNGYTSSPTGYSADNGFSPNRTNGYTSSPTGYFANNKPVIGHSSPTHYGPPGVYNPVYQQHFAGSPGGYSSNGHAYPYTYFVGSPGYGPNGNV